MTQENQVLSPVEQNRLDIKDVEKEVKAISKDMIKLKAEGGVYKRLFYAAVVPSLLSLLQLIFKWMGKG